MTLVSSTGETISFKFLIIATGARALKLEEFGVEGSDAENVCYLRNLSDANRLATVIQSSSNGNAVVIGGGYIGMECAASLIINKINVTMVLPGAHCSKYSPTIYSKNLVFCLCGWLDLFQFLMTVARLFTPKIATLYEEYYRGKGVKFIKGTTLTSFEFDSDKKVTAVNLKDGNQLPADLVVVGIGIRPNISLFEGQLTIEKGGIKVNSKMQSSDSNVYAIGDVATFPVKLYGEMRRLEHVDSARKSARHAVSAIMEPEKTGEFDYLPCFYSRFFAFSWQFYGDHVGEVVHFGDYEEGKVFGAYWVKNGYLVGTFLEGGTIEEYETISKATQLKPAVTDLEELGREGLGFAQTVVSQPVVVPEVEDVQSSEIVRQASSVVSLVTMEKPLHVWHAATGVAVAASAAAFAFWYGWRRRR